LDRKVQRGACSRPSTTSTLNVGASVTRWTKEIGARPARQARVNRASGFAMV